MCLLLGICARRGVLRRARATAGANGGDAVFLAIHHCGAAWELGRLCGLRILRRASHRPDVRMVRHKLLGRVWQCFRHTALGHSRSFAAKGVLEAVGTLTNLSEARLHREIFVARIEDFRNPVLVLWLVRRKLRGGMWQCFRQSALGLHRSFIAQGILEAAVGAFAKLSEARPYRDFFAVLVEDLRDLRAGRDQLLQQGCELRESGIVRIVVPSADEYPVVGLEHEVFLDVVNNERALHIPSEAAKVLCEKRTPWQCVLPVEAMVDEAVRVNLSDDPVGVILGGGREDYELVT
mmetsp:Transcript_10388/g.27543  ORF Transcript_10388/g.27543 Transcript_10388/m.27543 type:complete len:293 (-) Transcript_10388:1382-2260(-)